MKQARKASSEKPQASAQSRWINLVIRTCSCLVRKLWFQDLKSNARLKPGLALFLFLGASSSICELVEVDGLATL